MNTFKYGFCYTHKLTDLALYNASMLLIHAFISTKTTKNVGTPLFWFEFFIRGQIVANGPTFLGKEVHNRDCVMIYCTKLL